MSIDLFKYAFRSSPEVRQDIGDVASLALSKPGPGDVAPAPETSSGRSSISSVDSVGCDGDAVEVCVAGKGVGSSESPAPPSGPLPRSSSTSDFDFVEVALATDVEIETAEMARFVAMTAQIRSGKMLGSDIVEKYAQTWNASGCRVDTRLLHPDVVSGMEIRRDIFDALAKKKGPTLILPMILKGGWRREDHIVCAVVNPKTQTIEYFDPKGKKIEKEGREIRGLDQTPRELFDIEAQGAKRVSNSRGIQGFWNGTNCGVFVSKFMEMRASKGATFSAVCAHMSDDAAAHREQIAQSLEAANH